MSKVTDFEIVDLGVHHPDYFQGFGTSFTKFDNSVCGIGDTAQDAYDDALEQMATMGAFDGSGLDGLPLRAPFDGRVPDYDDELNADDGNHYQDSYYHVGIRWNV